MNLAFRLYNNSSGLVIVSFPKEGGDCVLRQSWNLESLDLVSEKVPERHSIATGDHKIPSRKSLVRGGFKIDILYNNRNIIVTPINKNKKELKTKRVTYRFEDLGIKKQDSKNYRDRTLRARLDKLPIDKNNKFKDLDL